MSKENTIQIKRILSLLFLALFSIMLFSSVSALDFDNDGYNSTIDCDDNDNQTYMNLTGFADFDNDNYTFGNITTLCTNGTLPTEYKYDMSNNSDCDDNNSLLFIALTGFTDFDNDTFTIGDELLLCTNGILPLGYTSSQNTEDCNDNNSNINPDMTELLYNTLDDDCNIDTKDELELFITLEKTSYNIGESIEYVIIGTSNSTVSINLDSPGDYYSYNANYLNQEYPIIDILTTTNKIGNYIIQGTISKDGFEKEAEISFEIVNSISIEISGDYTLLENETMSLTALATGGIGPYTYSWNLGDGTIKTGSSITHKYDDGDDYNLVLTVTDSEGNIKTKIIEAKIKNIYPVTFYVTNKNTNKPLSGVSLSTSSFDTLTGTTGIIKQNMVEGTYSFFAYKENYDMQNFEKRINNIMTINISLDKFDEVAPKITLIDDSIKTTEDFASIEFSVIDESIVSCSLYINEDASEWWNEIENIEDIRDNTLHNFDITDLIEGKTEFKIECVDIELNSAFSSIGTIAFSKEDEKTIEKHKKLLEEIDEILSKIDTLDLKTSKVYDALDIEDNLRVAKKYISSYSRDVYSLKEGSLCSGKLCDYTEKEITEKISELDKRILDSLENTIKDIKIIKSEEVIKYPDESNIKELLTAYFDSKNKIVSSKDMKKLVENNLDLQSKQKVLSKIYSVQMTYLDGRITDSSLIIKEIEINSTSSSQELVEFIPEISFDNFHSTQNYKELGNYLLSFEKDTKKIIYYVEERIDFDILLNTLTVLVDPIALKSTPLGFSIMDIKNNENLKSLIPINILGLIILARLFFFFDFHKKIKVRFTKNKDLVHSTNLLINDCLDYLDVNEFDKAVFIYKEIRLTYEKLPEHAKQEIYESIVNLVNIIDEKYVNKMIESNEKDKLRNIIPSMNADLRNKFMPIIQLMQR